MNSIKPNKHTLFSSILASAFISLIVASNAFAIDLFTEEEAAQLRFDDAEWIEFQTSSSSRGFTLENGPKIQVDQPVIEDGTQITAKSPTDLIILFEGTESKVDMSTLDIEIEKGWFSFSLTDKLSPYISGNQLAAEKVEIPSGKYVVLIEVKDLAGNKTERKYKLKVE